MGAKFGDVIYVKRTFLGKKYNHFGIYSGYFSKDNRPKTDWVIHYTKGDGMVKGIIDETPLEDFLGESREYYSVTLKMKDDKIIRTNEQHHSLASVVGPPPKIDILDLITPLFRAPMFIYEHFLKDPVLFSPEETVKRARKEIRKGEYNLVVHNCEHFALWCKTGVYDSQQVQDIIKGIEDSLFDVICYRV